MENIKIFTQLISSELHLQEHAVENTLKLLDEGCTIPFISRYRKERTGGLDEVQITSISNRLSQLQEIAKRKETIVKTITEQQKMTPDLQKRIDSCWDSTVLEDIYLPYKPKRRTRAQVAREQGLEPLATILLMQREPDPKRAAQRFVVAGGSPANVEDALKGAQDIIAEQVSEDERSRNLVRSAFRREAFIESKVVKAKKDSDEAQKYSDYFDWEEPLKRCSSHRLLAMRRGENEGILRISLTIDDEEAVQRLQRNYVHGNGPCQRLVAEAVEDGYKRTATLCAFRPEACNGHRPRLPYGLQGGMSRCTGQSAASRGHLPPPARESSNAGHHPSAGNVEEIPGRSHRHW